MNEGLKPSPHQPANHKDFGQLITPVVSTMPFAKLIGIQRSAARADRSTDGRTFLSPSESANSGAGNCRSRDCQLVTVLLPESPAMTNATITYSLRGRNRFYYRRNWLYYKRQRQDY
jgi:hypothetical protein